MKKVLEVLKKVFYNKVVLGAIVGSLLTLAGINLDQKTIDNLICSLPYVSGCIYNLDN